MVVGAKRGQFGRGWFSWQFRPGERFSVGDPPPRAVLPTCADEGREGEFARNPKIGVMIINTQAFAASLDESKNKV